MKLNPSLLFAVPCLLTIASTSAQAKKPIARVVKAPPALTGSGFYTPNRAPLQGLPFQKLPPGTVSPRGWLRGQLERDANGLSGHLSEISDYLKYEGNGWVDPKSDSGWEELPYWLRGYGDLGYVLNDPKIIRSKRTKWVEGILANQKPDGFFGPERLRYKADVKNGDGDPWPHMLVIDALHSYYEYSGDKRAFDFMSKFFNWQNQQDTKYFKTGWGALRWADNLYLVYWLYNQTGDKNLLDLAQKIHDNSANYVDNLPNGHNVNIAQGIREPGEYWMQSGDATHLKAVENDYQNVMQRFGQVPGGGFAGDENTRPGQDDPRQGFETCGIVEYMHTHEIMTRISGDPRWADRAEELAFNSLPAALTPDHKGVHYITSPNLVEINSSGVIGQFDNHFPMLTYKPGIHDYRCCPHNYGMGWPYYAEESWLATSDKGVAALLYTASEVRVKVGDGTPVTTLVTWKATTAYPFADSIQFNLSTPKKVNFPFYLRIPDWANNAEVRLNGKKVKVQPTPLSYVVLDRKWKNGDTVTLRLPMQVGLKKWNKNEDSVSVSYGPLWFALDMGEKWTRAGGSDEWPEMHVQAEKPWNYGLPADVKASDFAVSRVQVPSAQPFTPETTPLRLQTRARRVPGWEADAQGIVRPLQQSPALSNQPMETISLLPMGAARLRISSFPTVANNANALDWQPKAQGDLIIPDASFIHDRIEAINDNIVPTSSDDKTIPRFTWWDHVGGAEWASLTFNKPKLVSSASLYWFQDNAGCYAPASWKLMYQDGDTWKPVETTDDYATKIDGFNTVNFKPVVTTALRVDVQMQPDKSSGILEWKTDAQDAMR